MPRFNEVPTLETLSIKSVGKFIANLPRRIRSDIQIDIHKNPDCFQKYLKKLSVILISHINCYLYDTVAVKVLQAVDCYENEQLAELMLNSRLKHLDFSGWPEIDRSIFYKNLAKLHGLETLNLGSEIPKWPTFDCKTQIITAFKTMRNLRFLCLHCDCTDQIIQSISENCRHIQFIDVTFSCSVTDQSVQYLVQCQQLQELHLHCTSVTMGQHAILFSQLPYLQSVGRCDYFERIAKSLNQGPYNNFRKAIVEVFTARILDWLAPLFPKLESLCLHPLFSIQVDLSKLIYFNYLKELKLTRVGQYIQSFNQVIKLVGPQLMHLHLEDSEAIPLNSLLLIGNCCHNLTSLVILNSYFVKYHSFDESVNDFNKQTFSKLTKIYWDVRNSAIILEDIVCNAVDIEYLHVGYSTRIEHENVLNILLVNPMKCLKELSVEHSDNINMDTVQIILDSCPNLEVLSDLGQWSAISEVDLRTFENSIRSRNFKLNVSSPWKSLSCCCRTSYGYSCYQ